MNDETLLYRQVHPSWLQAGRITSQVFKPTLKDDQKLSAYDGDQITAERAWLHYTNDLKQWSAGVMSVAVQECRSESLTIDPDANPFLEHVSIDFSSRGGKSIDGIAKRLKRAAEARGWQYRAPAGA